jgi:hypothetical protein
MSVENPPFYENIVGQDGKATLRWLVFLQQLFDGDSGTVWTPNFVNLTTTGTPEITGRFYRLSKYLTFFHVNIIPATDTTSTAGTTYIDNYPVQFTNDGICFAVTGGLGDGPGHIVASSQRIFVPSWSAVTVPLTIIGIGEAT